MKVDFLVRVALARLVHVLPRRICSRTAPVPRGLTDPVTTSGCPATTLAEVVALTRKLDALILTWTVRLTFAARTTRKIHVVGLPGDVMVNLYAPVAEVTW